MKITFTTPATMNEVETATYNALRKVLMQKGRELLECTQSEEDVQYIDTEFTDEHNCTFWWHLGYQYDHIPFITYNNINQCLMVWYSDDEGIPVLKKDYEHTFDELRDLIQLLEKELAKIDEQNEMFRQWLILGRKLGFI